MTDDGAHMDHDSTQLSEEERRILAEIEHGLKRRERRLLGLFRRRKPGSGRRARWFWWMGVALGSGLIVGGLLAGAVWVAALGFIAVLVPLFVLTAGVGLANVVERLRRLVRGGDDTKPS